tara:strand:+ start:329 stop:556 length:228 start_codon:yes stop_codon:yes gene_type:complete
MIKAFHNYSIMERLSGGYTQWKKTYPDGEWAALVLPDKEITRKKIEEAFRDQENYAKFPDLYPEVWGLGRTEGRL